MKIIIPTEIDIDIDVIIENKENSNELLTYEDSIKEYIEYDYDLAYLSKENKEKIIKVVMNELKNRGLY